MEFADYFRFVLALAFVLALIGLLAAVARRYGFGFPVTALKAVGRRRLKVVEVTPVDARRRLVLVRRDDIEHLILLGQAGELVIETGIAARDDAPGASPPTAKLEDLS
ncbi:MAG TPA: flagellar biosynthetic protein FliO [Rhodospirillales bacterium]|jgi:flagellar protein FliO/FliZ